MKYIKLLGLALNFFLLCGCGQSKIFANYREMKQTELIQTIGFDRKGDEVGVTIATAVSPQGDFTIFTGRASTVAEALAEVHSFPSKRFLFFGHTGNIIIGSGATANMSDCFDFIERNNDIRLDTPLFIARGCSAEDIMQKADVNGAKVTELLQPLTDQTKKGALNHVFTAKEMIAVHTAEDYALALAVTLTEDGDKTSKGKVNIVPDGYAVIRGGAVVGYVEQADCLGVNLLINQPTGSILSVKDQSGGLVSLSLSNTDCQIEGVYSQSGSLEGITVKLSAKANVEQTDKDTDISDDAVRKYIEEQLAALLSDYCQRAIRISRTLETDFLGLGKRLHIHSPYLFEPYLSDFRRGPGDTKINIVVETLLERTYDIQQGEGVR